MTCSLKPSPSAIALWLVTLSLSCFSLNASAQEAPHDPLDLGPPSDATIELGGQRQLPLTEEELNRERWLNVVSAHSGTRLGLYEPIKVKLHKAHVSEEALSTTPAPELFVLSPQKAGYTYWSAPDELSFKPLNGWEAKTTYRVSLMPDPKLGNSPNTAPLSFSFVAEEPRLELAPLELSLDPNGEQATVKARLSLERSATLSQLSGVIKARQDGQPLSVSWERDAQALSWTATLRVQRYEEPSELSLFINGHALGSSLKRSQKLKLPKLGSFKVTRVYAMRRAERQFISIELSEPLDPEQELTGLARSEQVELDAEVDEGRLLLSLKREHKGALSVSLAPGLRSISGRKLRQGGLYHLTFERLNPQLRKVKQGAILPSVERPLFAFETRGLRSVEVTALLVKEPKLGQFLQENDLNGARHMTRVGRYLWRKRVALELKPEQLDGWQRHHLDLSSLVRDNPHGLIHLELSFNRGDASLSCDEQDALKPPLKRAPLVNQEAQDFDAPSAWDGDYYWGSAYEERRNPCKDAYYRRDRDGRSITQNILSSNIGVLSKKGASAERFFAVTNLLNAQPISGARVSLYNYQNELLSSGVSDQDGFARIQEPRAVFYARVDHEGALGVLKLDARSKLATTHFDVGGVERSKGFDGALYAERGMWRPGDDIYLTFVLQDPKSSLPQGHPIFVSFKDPQGTELSRFMIRRDLNGFYPFVLKTDEGAETGPWSVTVEVGGERFTKQLSIETFEPNRLQVNLRLPKQELTSDELPAQLSVFSQWLHGAKAGGLDAQVGLSLSSIPTRFSAAREFTFSDPTRSFNYWSDELFKGPLDDEGYAHFTWEAPQELPFGTVRARFSTQVFERSGASSIEYRNATILHGERFVGLRLPKGDQRGMLLTDRPHQVLIKTLNAQGKPVDGAPLMVKLYKIRWKWWWDKSSDNLNQIEGMHHSELLQSATVDTVNGDAQWDLEVKSPIWGRFLLKVCETPKGHCSAQTLYIDWPGWANESGEKAIGATYLPMTLDAERYQVGQVAKLKLPPMPQGRALVSVESGAHLLSQRWVELSEAETELSIPITAGMAPNVYVSVTALQPHAHSNDRPIRLYTILPIMVDDPQTKLQPLINAPSEVRPETELNVEVSEERGAPMTYTLALVDEGLLGVTAFKTPNLHKSFFKRLALGVKSWDLFDDVIGAYGGVVERLLSVGGAEALDDEEDKRRRFEPVVIYRGPFELKAGERASHRLMLPQYVGAVRLMVVAGHQERERSAYGSAEAKVTVRQPLMLLANLPRSIGPQEELSLPVSVFATSPELRTVELFARSSDPLSQLSAHASLSFDQPRVQEQLARLSLKTSEQVGVQTLRFTAESGAWVARQKVNLPVRVGSPPSSHSTRLELEAGESIQLQFKPYGLPGTRSGSLELSRIPKLQIDTQLRYLIGYPHGCAEQTTSKAFPQLYLPALMKLSAAQRAQAQLHVEEAIKKLRKMQTPNGDFAYWSGAGVNDWTNSYVGHFLLEADRLGYEVPEQQLSAWKRRQGELAQGWRDDGSRAREEQSYRLLTLALARSPQLGAMNRLRQSEKLEETSRWLLARAYALIGQGEAARELIQGLTLPERAEPETELMRGFKSLTRDRALALTTLVALQDRARAEALALELISGLAEQGAAHTHELATALRALGVWAGSLGSQEGRVYGVDYSFDGTQRFLYGPQLILQHELSDAELSAEQLELKNDSQDKVYLSLNRRGVPRPGEEQEGSSGLQLSLSYHDPSGAVVDPAQLKQGAELITKLKVKNLKSAALGQLALTYATPSGWRIENDRLSGRSSGQSELVHQDIRDDRVLFYFTLKSGEERSYEVKSRAAFEGRFYHPATRVEAMYVPEAFAQSRGFWTQVRR